MFQVLVPILYDISSRVDIGCVMSTIYNLYNIILIPRIHKGDSCLVKQVEQNERSASEWYVISNNVTKSDLKL